jgi:CheY-like chemotaxis protein
MKILVVDDFDLMRVMLIQVMQDLRMTQIEEAAGGQEAITKIIVAQEQNQAFDFVFCDWNMPDVDGMDVLTYCKTNLPPKSTVFVMVTAETDQHSILQALKSGADEYITKPISKEDLTLRLQKIFAKRKASSAA